MKGELMRKSYCIKRAILSLLFLLFIVPIGSAQTVGDIMWQDLFEDYAEDSLLRFNVGWFYYGQSDGLFGQVVKQTPDNYAQILTGSYGGIVGAGIIQTNGVPALDSLDVEGTKEALLLNNYSDPNQEITFRFNLFQMAPGAIFMCGTRMPMTDSTETFPDAELTEEPAYTLFFSPFEGLIMIAKYEGEMAVLAPDAWDTLGVAEFGVEQDVWYWAKFYLYEGELKAKIWEGDLSDEEDVWLIETTDADPRVEGKYTMFAMFNVLNTGGGDILKIDDVYVRGFTTDLEDPETVSPAKFELADNYPNPFNPQTTIEFSIAKTDNVSLKIYDISGRLVRMLVNRAMTAGSHKVVFDGRDDAGLPLSSGVYFYQLQSGAQSFTKKMILIK
jgi:hypothetical protein